MREHSKIAIIIGTKAELIKCMPIMQELQKRGKDYWFIHTGQHPLGKSCEEFGVKKPDFILSKEPEISTKFWSKINNFSIFWCFTMIPKIKRLLKKLKPNYVIYHGDTMSTAVASIGSSKFFNKEKEWKNVHLEAGLRSGSLFEPFPEEISRQISDKFSDILLAVSDFTEKNLRKSKRVSGKIMKMGNTIIDSALITHEKSKKTNKKKNYEYVLINIHRHENLNNKKRLSQIVEILSHIKSKAIWPLHDNTKRYLIEYGLMKEVASLKNIEITSLESYDKFLFLMSNAKYLIADGGSIQEESLVFKKPCLILRKRTERQEGLNTGFNFLTMDVKKAKEIIKRMEKGIKIQEFKNPYGEKGVSKKIVEILLK